MKSPAKATLDPWKIFNQGNRFYLANVRLRGNDHPTEHIKVFAGPALVLSAFAAELFFKCLICMESNTAPKTHNLKNLFRRLSPATRKRIEEKWDAYIPSQAQKYAWIEQTFGERIPTDLNWTLTAGARAFDNLRYVHERDDTADDRIFIVDLPKLLLEVIFEKRPEWRPHRKA